MIFGIVLVIEGIEVVGGIVLILVGVFCLVVVIMKVFNKLLMKLGKVLGMNEVVVVGMVVILVNNIFMF